MTDPSKPSAPTTEKLAAWRAACVAYRRVRQSGLLDEPARNAAIAAFRAVRPDVPEREASDEVAHAICYAASEHKEWFWRGVGRNK